MVEHKVVVDNPGCSRCEDGKTWNVEDSNGCLVSGESYGDRDDAEYLKDLLNTAFDEGVTSGYAKGIKKK